MAYTIYYKHNRSAGLSNVPFDPEYQSYFQNRQAVWERHGTTGTPGTVDEGFMGTDTSPTGEPWQLIPQCIEIDDPSVFQTIHAEIDSHELANTLHNDCVNNLVTIRYKIVNNDTQEVVSDWANVSDDRGLRT